MPFTRRRFLQTTVAALVSTPAVTLAKREEPHADVSGLLGVTTGSFMRNLTVQPQPGKLRLLDLPQIMRDELGMRVIDLMTATLASFEPRYLESLRAKAEKANCLLTNLKMNQRGLDMGSPDAAKRKKALDEYKRTIDAAARLGCRWVRPLPLSKRPDIDSYVAAYRELIDYARPKGISLLVENFGWMQDDPEAIPNMIRRVGKGLDASPDTGNWTNEARYGGLEKAFPLAVTCDFKAKQMGPKGEHAAYDLKRCFDIGRQAGFKGPWCFEHANADLKEVLREMGLLRDMLTGWMKA